MVELVQILKFGW